jgi:hypothetical protein
MIIRGTLLSFLASFLILSPSIGWGEDLFDAANNPTGASRFTVNKFGYNNDVDTAEESIWDVDDLPTEGDGPVRCFANMNTGTTPTAALLYISSDDEDDAADGTGKVVITVEGLDGNWNLKSETVALGDASASGTEFAAIGTGTWMRVNRAFVHSTSVVAPEGNIYIHKDDADGGTDGVPDTVATDAVAAITAGENQTLQACYSVPNGYNAFMTHWCISNAGMGATALTLRWRASINGAASRNQSLMPLADATSDCSVIDPPHKFVEKTDIEVTGSDATSQNGAATFGLVLIKNTLSGL